MKGELIIAITEAAKRAGIAAPKVALEYPENPDHGDFSTSVALVHAKEAKKSPKALAEAIVTELKQSLPSYVKGVEIAGAGFINLRISDKEFANIAVGMSVEAEGSTKDKNAPKKVLVEYTDPNTFKVFHIGHLMSNAIGESLSRLIEATGSKVVRICYPSDIGLHIAKSVWAIQKNIAQLPSDSAPIKERTAFLGKMYVEGTNAYDADPKVKAEIDALNKVIYEKSDKKVNELAAKGRSWSIEHFEELYKILGTKFNDVIYESDMAPIGLELVRANKNIFTESEGAVIFKGEDHGLHTRVFINSHGLPTYEAKELGLNITKFKKNPDADLSIIITANEQNDYFRVLTKAISLVDPKDGSKLRHVGHGLMRFASGKMSSRKGNVITADDLIADIKATVLEKMVDREFEPGQAEDIAGEVAIAAIKYTVLRSAVGSDIIFDSAASISFEGDSGPYLQYSAVRANSVLQKVENHAKVSVLPEQVGMLERLISRFPDIVARSARELSPQQVAGYLIQLAGAFNAFYANNQILDTKEPLSPYRIALTKAFYNTMTQGLWLLGIKVPKKM